MEPAEIKFEMKDRKKASCCERSAPVNNYRYLLKSGKRNCFEFL